MIKLKLTIIFSIIFLFSISFVNANVTQDDLLDGLVSYYDGSYSSTTAIDVHGTNNGTASNSRVFGTDGQIGKGFDFSKGNDWITLSSFGDLETISFWWIPSVNFGDGETNTWDPVLGKVDSSYDSFFAGRVFGSSTGTDIFYIATGSGIGWYWDAEDFSATSTNNRYEANTPYHFVVYWESSDSFVYLSINGEIVKGKKRGSPARPNLDNFVMGRRSTIYATEVADELGIWNRALTQAEITALYDIQKDGYTTGSYDFSGAFQSPNATFTAKDIHTNNTINNFSVIIDSITYNTTNGTITTHILQNSTSLWDINISSDGYYNRTYTNYNVTSNLEAELTPYNITIYSPENNTEVAENFNASFKVFTDGTINKCELLINEVVNQTINNLDNETTYNFILEFNPGDEVEFNWSIKCDINSKEFITANRNYKFRSLLIINLYDERTNQFINESISFLFRSSTYEWNQTTTNGTITLYGNEGLPMGVYEIIMSSVNYYPRSYYVDISTISQTINLYLLLRNESSTHTFFVKNLQDRVLDNISIEFMKLINLTWLPVTQKFTDFSGAILVNLDPLVRYKITFQDPSGEYLPKEAYIEPIFSTYTIFLNYNQSSYFETVWDSVSYYISQTNTSLNPIETEFKLTVISTTGNILFFGLSAEINGTTYINNITGSPGGGSAIINLPLDEEENKNINVKYWIKTSNPHYLELSKTHSIINLTAYEGEYSLVKIQQPFRDELSPRMRILLASFFIIVVVSFATLFIRKSYSVLVGVPLLIIFAIPIIGWIPIWLATFQSIMLIGFFVVFGEWS